MSRSSAFAVKEEADEELEHLALTSPPGASDSLFHNAATPQNHANLSFRDTHTKFARDLEQEKHEASIVLHVCADQLQSLPL